MVNAFGAMFQGLNKFCEEKALKWRNSLSSVSSKNRERIKLLPIFYVPTPLLWTGMRAFFTDPPSPMVPPPATADTMALQQPAGSSCSPRWQSSASASGSSSTTSGVPTSNFVSSPSLRGDSSAQSNAMDGAEMHLDVGHGERRRDRQQTTNSRKVGRRQSLIPRNDAVEEAEEVAARKQRTKMMIGEMNEEEGGGMGGGIGTGGLEFMRRRSAGSTTSSRRSLEEALARRGTATESDGGKRMGKICKFPPPLHLKANRFRE